MRQQQGGGGGGGGGGGQMANELADLFQLQLDRQANQYETQQRAQQQSAAQQVDELAERLKELARRQLQQAEQQRRGRGQQGGARAAAHRSASLADEVEQAARQLEQLQREPSGRASSGRISPTRRSGCRNPRTRCGRRRPTATGRRRPGEAGVAAARGGAEAAAEQSDAQAGQNVKDLQRQAEDLAKQQRDIASRSPAWIQAGGERKQRIQQLSQDKDEMRGKVGEIEQQLGNLARQSLANNQRDAARKLQEAAGTIRDGMLKEKIEYSKQAMAGGSEYSKPIENEIGSDIERCGSARRRGVGRRPRAAGPGAPARRDKCARAARLQTLEDRWTAGSQGQQGQQGQGQQGQGQKGASRARRPGQREGPGRGQGRRGQGRRGQSRRGQGRRRQGRRRQGRRPTCKDGDGKRGDGKGGDGKGGGQPGRGQGSQRLEDGQKGGGEGKDGSGKLTGTPAPQGSRNASGDARPELAGQIRQWTNQANQLANEAADVKQQLQKAGISQRDLTPVDEVVKALRALGDAKSSQSGAAAGPAQHGGREVQSAQVRSPQEGGHDQRGVVPLGFRRGAAEVQGPDSGVLPRALQEGRQGQVIPGTPGRPVHQGTRNLLTLSFIVLNRVAASRPATRVLF